MIISNELGMIQVASRVSKQLKNKDLGKLWNIKKVSKLHKFIA